MDVLTRHNNNMGFLPYASDRLPTIGLVKNCRKLYKDPKAPPNKTEAKRSGAPVSL